MPRLAHDIRYAVRTLGKAPLFTTVAIVSLGLALALNTSMFALADAVQHPPNPYPDAARIIIPWFRGGDPRHPVPNDTRVRVLREGVHSADAIATYTRIAAFVETSTTADDMEPVAVSPEFFRVLGVRPLAGRTIGSADAGASATQSAVISYRLWNRFFNGRPLRDTLTLDVARVRYTVVGVMPRGVHYPIDTDIWLPLSAMPTDASLRRYGPAAILHLRPGVPFATAGAEIDLVAKNLTAEYSPKAPLSVWIWPIGGREGPRLGYFSGFVFSTLMMVLIIACANLATMLVARGLARRRETAIRVALGASRSDVVRSVLVECGLITAGGLALGTLLTFWALYVLPHLTIPWVQRLGDLQPVPSWRVFAFAFGASALTVIVAGSVPALRAAAVDPSEPMKEGAGTTTGRLRDRYNPLIMVEVGLSTTLLMCSALFVLVAVRLAIFEFGYAAKRLVVAELSVAPRQLPSGSSIPRFYYDVAERAGRLHGAEGAATFRWQLSANGLVLAEEGKTGTTWMNVTGYNVVSPDFLRTVGISMIRGRDFVAGDATGASPVAIVDEDAAKRLWPDMPDPVGRMMKLGGPRSSAPWIRVVGMAAAIEYQPRTDPDLPPEPMIYVVMPNDSMTARQLVVRGDGGGARGRAALALALKRDLRNALPSATAIPVHPWLDAYEHRRALEEFLASLFGAFAGFGLALCAVGLYGVLAYTVSRRLREFAVRIALGARRRDVARLVLHDAAVTALAGVGVGAFFALWITRAIADTIPLSYATVVALVAAEAVLFAVATVASLGPVRRAAKADPVEILRAI